MGYKGKYSGQRLEELLDKVANNEITPDLSGYATKEELDDKQDTIVDLEAIRSGAAKGETALQSIPDEYVTKDEVAAMGYATSESVNASLFEKVDKVIGKQLSTEDFTTVLKEKLQGLANYNDSELKNAVDILRRDLDALVSGNSTEAIETFNEIIAFLEGIDDSQNLDSIIASIEQQIAALNKKIEGGGTMPDLSGYATKDEVGRKQDNLVSGKNIKTINGLNILGEGNIEIQGSGVSKNTAEIKLTTPVFNAVLEGTKGNYIEFTFDTYNENGNTLGESVTCTYTIIRASSRKTITERYRYNERVKFNIDNYLKEGTNDITVNIVGNISGASTAVGLSYQVVNIALSDELDISTVYDLSQGAVTVEVPFTVTGYGTKVIEWYIDGVLLPFVKNEDEVVDMTASRFKYITLSNLQQGSHSLQFRAYTAINGEKFYTDTLYRDLLVYTGVDTNTLIGIATTIPSSKGVLAATEPVALFDVVQYIPYTLRFATYSPTAIANTNVNIAINDAIKGVILSNNGVENRFTFTESKAGSKNLSLSVADASYTLPVSVSPTTMNLEDITTGLVIDFNALGKSNNSKDRDTWTDGTYTGTLTGFNYNNTSGWVDGRLELNEGSSFALNLAPLSGSPVDTGRTIEIEWASKNVCDDDAIICDMRDSGGAGILITATKVSIKSINGVVIETEYKSNENVRIGFVINRASGVTEQKLSYIYANGVISRATSWGIGDDYTSSKEMVFTGSSGALVSLKSIKVYNTALTSDNMLNNYILYRDTVAEMIEVYDRNDIYEKGTSTFSPDKMMGRLPVMIVTGDIPTLENTSDKDTQIVVDIEYFNLQEPSKSFTMKNAAMRPQGTSSMGYPKKNFRIYTQKLDDTIIYDSNGQVIEDKLYSFKESAQPVNCWCLKADYAESSGTHNTGIARMWNDALFNAQIDGEYKLRTGAQKAALAANYPYDVRTTIDGFPILLFYRRTANDNLIFIGKYNFNNDKSTESVFGFKGIPGFDNSKMQCWEILNNGNPLALFTTVDGFDNSWSEAFESRYPDTKTPNTDDLKAFCQWMVNVSQSDFATEKWEHLNVYMMAAYWVYLMRHAGADQFVKNAMFTSEDGQKFYYILYDNDTINGLINTGDIAINPTDTRQTVDASGAYVFAGHDSRLWNMLEADNEFMEIVEKVDNALYSAGISYINAIKMFDEEQADKWVEKIYNQDAQYKYIGPYVEKGINNLFMLQGKRDLHRRWWLAKRFYIYDAKYVSGSYKSQAIEIKCLNGTEAGQKFTIKAGYPLDYGYGINNVPRSKGVSLGIGQSHTFTTTEVVNLGDPIRIYGAPNIEEVDLSAMSNRLAVVTITNVYTDALGTKLKKLILGGEGVNNIEVTEISGLKMAKLLTHLDVRGMQGIKSLDLSTQPYFEELKATNTSVASVTFAKGAPVTRLELPTTIKALNLEQLPYLTAINIVLADITGIHTINVKGCPNLANDFSWVNNWYNRKSTVDSKCTLIMDNVNWSSVNVDDLLNISKIGTLSLKGKVVLESITLEQVNALKAAFGESAFDRNSDFQIDAPPSIFVTGRTEVVEGESEQYTAVVFGGTLQRVSWSIISGANAKVAISNTGLLTVSEGYGNGTIVIRARAFTDNGITDMDTTVTIKAIVFPTKEQTSIVGNSPLEEEYETFRLQHTIDVTGKMSAVWSLEGLEGYAEIYSYDDKSCVIRKIQDVQTSLSGTLSCALSKQNGASLFTVTRSVDMANPNIAETDAGICKALYDAGLCANETFITKEEAAVVKSEDLNPMGSMYSSIFYNHRADIKSFNGFKYFSGVTVLRKATFEGSNVMTSIEFPTSLTSIESRCFYNCDALLKVHLNEGLLSLGSDCFVGCDKLSSAYIPDTVISVDNGGMFQNCSALTSVHLPSGMTTLGNNFFSGCWSLSEVIIPSGVTSLGNSCFYSCKALASIELPDGLTSIGTYAFCQTGLLSVDIPNNVETLGQNLLENCTSLVSVRILSNKLTEIPRYAFHKASSLSTVEIPPQVTLIGDLAFGECVALTEITLPAQLTTIGQRCFEICTKLSAIEIPESITEIGAQCFASCKALRDIKCYRNTAPSLGSGAFGSSEYSYTGRNTYNTGANILLVPSGATGYDTGDWLDPLCNSAKCGFTLSATL